MAVTKAINILLLQAMVSITSFPPLVLPVEVRHLRTCAEEAED